MLLLVDVAGDEVLEALAERVQLRMVVRALLAWSAFRLQLIRLATLVLVAMCCVGVVLVDLRICSSLPVDIQRLQHVLHVLELFCFQCGVDPVDHVVVSLLLLLFHLRELLEVLFRFLLIAFRNTRKGRWKRL